MRTHTQEFKNQIKELGREIDSRITYGENIITSEELYCISPVVNGGILKSAMKELDFESSVQVPINTIVTYEFGLKVNGSYEYLNYGNYIVYSSEYKEDTKTYEHVCYDSMLFTMKDYTNLQNGTFPMTIREYITNLCLDCNLIFKNSNQEFANYNKTLDTDLYANLGYTYRDIYDELAQVTASTICVDSNNMVEVRYINETNDEIDEEYLKDVNVKFGEKYGPINSIVLSRSAESDNVYLQDESSIESNGLCEIKIVDNQIMNFNNRSDYLPDILEKLNGLEYYLNDYSSTGILYYELCDKYNIKIGENTYNCILFNDEQKITQGLVENIYTEKPEESVTDYTKADKTDRKINQAYILVDKQNQKINALTENVDNIDLTLTTRKDASGFNNIHIQDAGNYNVAEFGIDGNTYQEIDPTSNNLQEIEIVEGYNLFDGLIELGTFDANGNTAENLNCVRTINYIEVKPSTSYIIFSDLGYQAVVQCYDENKTFIKALSDNTGNVLTPENTKYIKWRSSIGNVENNLDVKYQLTKGTTAKPYVPYRNIGIRNIAKNLLNLKSGTYTSNGISATVQNGVITLNGTATAISFITIPLLNETILTNNIDYMLSANNTNVVGDATNYCSLRLNNEGNYQATLNNSNATYCFNRSIDYSLTYITIRTASSIVYNNFVIKPQLELGTTATNWEQYQKQITYIDLKGNFIGKVGDIKDKLYIKDGHTYLEKYIGKVILDGSHTLTFPTQTFETVTRFVFSNVINSIRNTQCLSDYFTWYENQSSNTGFSLVDGEAIHIRDNPTEIGIKINKSIASSSEELISWLSKDPVAVYYILATPETIDLGEVSFKTYEGINNISLLASMNTDIDVIYLTDSPLNGEYATKAELIIESDKITSEVNNKVDVDVFDNAITELDGTTNQLGTAVTNNYQEIMNKFGNYTPTSQTIQLEQSVKQIQTDTYTKTEINSKLTDGSVTKVHTVSGTFDEDGMHYEKTNAPTSTTINESGVEVDSTTSGEELLFAGYDEELQQTIVRTENLTVRRYLVIGDNTRIETYESGGGIFIL